MFKVISSFVNKYRNFTKVLLNLTCDEIEPKLEADVKSSASFINLNFIGTNNVDFDRLLRDENYFEPFLADDINGNSEIEGAYMDTMENVQKLLNFVFNQQIDLVELSSNQNKKIFDLSKYKNLCISYDFLESNFKNWLVISSREGTMDEYGNLIFIIGFINSHREKEYLILVTE